MGIILVLLISLSIINLLLRTTIRHPFWWRYYSLLFLCFATIPQSVSAQTDDIIFSEQALSFGIIAVGNKKEISTITITNNGELYSTNQIHILQPGHPAIFSLVNYPPNTKLTIIASILKPQMDTQHNTQGNMTLIKLTTDEFITTDGTGFASVKVGGTLQTSGPIKNSDDQGIDYNAQIVLDIHY